ncbi:MAG TPA: putative LPS assembly protein LptD [Longimicrobiaceae bacterium]|nr:putative LPS assembly protein LptD [Longimicrobiaceae bacterium]
MRRPVGRHPGRALLLGALLAAAGLVLARGTSGEAARRVLAQQVPPRAAARDTIPRRGTPRDTIPRDTTRRDTLRADSARAQRPPPPADSIVDALLRLEGYTPIRYQGERAEFVADSAGGVLTLEGQAVVEREGDRLTADTITYWRASQLVRAVGSPRVEGQAQQLAGDVLFYDLARRRASVVGGRTTVSEGTQWIVQGNVTAQGTDSLYATSSTFTTDDRPQPQYHFEADQIKVIRNRILVGRPARLYFGKVPVAWLPFIVQDMTRGRRSGLLTPQFSINDIVRTSQGYTREISNVGFYWAASDYFDAQLAGRWRSGTYTGLLTAGRFNSRRHFLSGDVAAEWYWPQNSGRQLTLRANSAWRPDERTSLGLSADYSSSSTFIRNFSTDPMEARTDLGSRFSANRRFDWGAVDFGATRRQFLADNRVETTLPQLGVNFTPITLFRAAPDGARWYNNASLNLNGSLTRSATTIGDDTINLRRGFFDREQTIANASQSLSMGSLNLSTSGSINRELLGAVVPPPEMTGIVPLPERNRDIAQWNSTLSYRIPLIGATSISPNLSLSQSFLRDSVTRVDPTDPASPRELVGGPVRMNFGASLQPELFGFFPGFGPYSAIRHHVRPQLSYRYSPAPQQTPRQDSVFGRFSGHAQNVIELSLTQTFEAKLRQPPTREPTDTTRTIGDTTTLAGADTTAGAFAAAAPPAEPQKVSLLSITTSAISYDFVRATEGGNGFITQQVNNSVRSDLLQGLNLDFTHELFDRTDLEDPEEMGRFAPHLSQLNLSFSFGQESALFRFLGIGGAPRPEATTVRQEGLVPGEQESLDPNPRGSETFTGNPRGSGGPWRAAISYSLVRPRIPASATGPGFRSGESQNINGQLSFAPTANWSVNWTTSYSVTDGKFGQHSLNLRRSLYRWEADFAFSRTVYGNSAFSATVRLIDLPDLKVDYRERNLGGRGQTGF